MLTKNFWKNKKILITGNTGFKGSWLSIFLIEKDAKIVGISKRERQGLFLYNYLNLKKKIKQYYFDIYDYKKVNKVLKQEKPDIIFHLAAQPLVKESYDNPYSTIFTNVIGTVNILEAARNLKKKISIINVTTDKVYKQSLKKILFSEEDKLGGNDIYSASKACSDILTHSYYKSFFEKNKIGIATARAGNVIGGFDWSNNRIIPDAIKSSYNKKKLIVRMPKSVRPWQHVLDVVNGYCVLAEKLYKNPYSHSGAWNFGPNKSSNKTVLELLNKLDTFLPKRLDIKFKKAKFHEEMKIELNNNKSIRSLNWKPKFNFHRSVKLTAQIYDLYYKEKLNYNDFRKQLKELHK